MQKGIFSNPPPNRLHTIYMPNLLNHKLPLLHQCVRSMWMDPQNLFNYIKMSSFYAFHYTNHYEKLVKLHYICSLGAYNVYLPLGAQEIPRAIVWPVCL